MYDKIFKRVLKNGQKLFLLSSQKAGSNSLVQELWHYRFIHVLNEKYPVLSDDNLLQEYTVYSMDYGKLLSLKVNKTGESLVDNIASTAKIIIEIGLPLGRLGISEVIGRLIAKSVIGGKLRELGSVMVANKGVETADSNNINSLIKDCLFDDLLSDYHGQSAE